MCLWFYGNRSWFVFGNIRNWPFLCTKCSLHISWKKPNCKDNCRKNWRFFRYSTILLQRFKVYPIRVWSFRTQNSNVVSLEIMSYATICCEDFEQNSMNFQQDLCCVREYASERLRIYFVWNPWIKVIDSISYAALSIRPKPCQIGYVMLSNKNIIQNVVWTFNACTFIMRSYCWKYLQFHLNSSQHTVIPQYILHSIKL